MGSNLKFVELDCACDAWSESRTQQVFSSIIELRLRGYRDAYGPRVLPVDTTDFLATHYALCREQEGRLVPAAVFRLITADRCRTFNVLFPALGLVRAVQATEHERYVQGAVEQAEQRNRPISYSSGFTIDPSVRQHDRELVAEIKRMVSASMALYAESHGEVDVISGANVRLKMEPFHQRMGFERASLGGRALPAFGAAFAHGAEVVLMHLRQPSAHSLQLASEFRSAWSERLRLGVARALQPTSWAV